MKKRDLRALLASYALRALPASARQELYLDEKTCDTIGVRLARTFRLSKNLQVTMASLHANFRAAAAHRKVGTLRLADGRTVKSRLGLQRTGSVWIEVGKEQFVFDDADLFSESKAARLAAVKRVLSERPLRESEEERWLSFAKKRAFADWEFVQLMTDIGMTPEAVSRGLRGPQTLTFDALVPNDPEYYHRLVAPVISSHTLEAYQANEAATSRRWLIKTKRKVRARRLAFTAASHALIPFDDLGALTFEEIANLKSSGDPFSLLFGFELCRQRLPKDKQRYQKLGAEFLTQLVTDNERNRAMCELYCACAVLTIARLRRVFDETSVPLFHFRLTALAHAGVLADALRTMSTTADFMKWSFDNTGPEFLWHTTVDRRDAPRWRSDWVSPEYLYTELVGRCAHAIARLPKSKQPPSWKKMVQAALDNLAKHDRGLAPFFPGPMDDFWMQDGNVAVHPEFAKIEAKLHKAKKLATVRGLTGLAYLGRPSKEAAEDVRRLLEKAGRGPDAATLDRKLLGLCAHIAVCARSEALANTVIDACVRKVGGGDQKADVDLFLIAVEACGSFSDRAAHHEALGKVATRFSYAFPVDRDMMPFRSILETLGERDPKLISPLGRAAALVETAEIDH